MMDWTGEVRRERGYDGREKKERCEDRWGKEKSRVCGRHISWMKRSEEMRKNKRAMPIHGISKIESSLILYVKSNGFDIT